MKRLRRGTKVTQYKSKRMEYRIIVGILLGTAGFFQNDASTNACCNRRARIHILVALRSHMLRGYSKPFGETARAGIGAEG